ncbi:Alpha/Beta hydrolase protein [Syncephalis plumigaleata]|nr:Alpha/Beta hydrolase protein [Syncephalis plumigaleata]
MRTLTSLYTLAIAFVATSNALVQAINYHPVVLWHGMGDDCCNPDSMGTVVKFIEARLPGVFVHSINTASDPDSDRKASFFGVINDQIDSVCQQLKKIPELRNGFNAIGFSQGGLFMRGYVQRCNDPPVHNLVTFGSPHMGVSEVPGCTGKFSLWCSLMRSIVNGQVYGSWAQTHSIQAQYFKLLSKMDDYMKHSVFLPFINNEHETKNATYNKRINQLERLVLIRFADDVTIIPKETAWFGFYNTHGNQTLSLKELPIYKEDWIGLRELDTSGRLIFKEAPGQHMRISLDYLDVEVLRPYFSKRHDQRLVMQLDTDETDFTKL